MPTLNDYLKYGETALAAYALNLSPGLIDIDGLVCTGMGGCFGLEYAQASHHRDRTRS
jgi:hypothetical protein